MAKSKQLALMNEGLTFKEDRFCREYFENACEDPCGAYLRAYDVVVTEANPRPSWVYTAASKLLKQPRIWKRIEVFCKRLEDVAMYSADRAMREAGEAFEKAMANNQIGAAINAVKLRAQLAGHLVEKREITTRTERDMSAEELDQRMDEAAKAAGYVISKAAAKAK